MSYFAPPATIVVAVVVVVVGGGGGGVVNNSLGSRIFTGIFYDFFHPIFGTNGHVIKVRWWNLEYGKNLTIL